MLDTITSHTSPDPAADWLRCEQLLGQAYRSLQQATRVANQPEGIKV